MKKKIIVLILLLFVTFPVLASTNTKERTADNNYGVTKFEVTSKNKDYILKTPYVDASEKIYDFSDILTAEEEASLYEKMENFHEKTNYDFVIVTSSLQYSMDSANEDYAADFYDFNDFGKNGVIFYRNTYEADPYYGLYSFGEAQLVITNNRIESYILDDIYDDIHEKRYYEGLSKLIDILDSTYDKGVDPSYSNYYVDENGMLQKEKNYETPVLISLAIAGIVTAITMSSMVSKNKMIRAAIRATEYVDRANTNMTVKQDNFIRSATTSHYIGSSSSSSGGGHSSSIGHSGGGHSGGGRHG